MLRTESLLACPVCAAANPRHLLDARDYESGTGDYGIDECAACGIAFTNPRPVEADLPNLYAMRSSADFPPAEGIAQRLRRWVIERQLRAQLAWLRDRRDAAAHLLDFGCGDGMFAAGIARVAPRLHFRAHVIAVDFHDSAPPPLRGSGDVDYMPHAIWLRDDRRYDAIFLRHVLEHHPAPQELLRELGARLRPGGRLYIEVPNRYSIWARFFGSCYFGYYVPRHLFHFDPASLRMIVERASLRSIGVRLGHTPIIGRSLGYRFGRDIGNLGFLGLATYPIQVAIDVLAGRSTTLRATVVADG